LNVSLARYGLRIHETEKKKCFVFQVLDFLHGRGVDEIVVEQFGKQKVIMAC